MELRGQKKSRICRLAEDALTGEGLCSMDSDSKFSPLIQHFMLFREMTAASCEKLNKYMD